MSPDVAAPLVVAPAFVTVAVARALVSRQARIARAIGTLAVVSVWLVAKATGGGSVDSIFAVTLFGLSVTFLSEWFASRDRES